MECGKHAVFEGAMSSLTAKVTDASFETDVIKSDEPVVVDFWRNGAGHAA